MRVQPDSTQTTLAALTKHHKSNTVYQREVAAVCKHAQSCESKPTCAVSDSSPEEATRLMGPEAHMMAFTSSCKLSALRNLLSAKMSSTRQALMQDTVLWVASISRAEASPGGPESAPSSEIRLHRGNRRFRTHQSDPTLPAGMG